MALAGNQEEFLLSEYESWSHVDRPDWPTRENDIICSMQAAVVCTSSECEALLCSLARAKVRRMPASVLRRVLADHEQQEHSKKTSGRETNLPEKRRYAGR